MRAVEVVAFGGPEVLRVADREAPRPGTGQVLVRIRAATVNPTDLAARSGALRSMLPDIQPPFALGWDLAGEVLEVGAGTAAYQPGDRVVGMIPWPRTGGQVGAYAELAAVDPGWLAPLPAAVDDAAAATLPLNALTAWQALDMIAPAPGSTLLITGASGGVGGFATQLAVRAGHRVLAVAGRDDEQWVGSLGPAKVLPRSTDLTRVGPVDAVLDAVPVGVRVAAAVRDGGTVVFTRHPSPHAPGREVRLQTVLVRPDRVALRELAADLAAGQLRTRVAEAMPLDQADRAHRRAEAGATHGKLVLLP
jgi:NADPH2:quinone reductase